MTVRSKCSRRSRRMQAVLVMTVLVCACAVVFGDPQPKPSEVESRDPVARGRQFAEIICSVCHVVAPNQPVPLKVEARAPAFAQIANRPAVTKASLRKFILTIHWDETAHAAGMPGLTLTREQADDLVAYILSLRR